jgi:hypothetical protein
MTDMACQFMTFEVRDIVNRCSVDHRSAPWY